MTDVYVIAIISAELTLKCSHFNTEAIYCDFYHVKNSAAAAAEVHQN